MNACDLPNEADRKHALRAERSRRVELPPPDPQEGPVPLTPFSEMQEIG